MNRFFLLGLALAVSACVGRTPEPVPVQTSLDGNMSCTELHGEIRNNEVYITHLQNEERETQAYNITVGSAAVVFFPPALVALDISDADKVETNALNERNGHLEGLRVGKGCHTEALVPAGYDGFARVPQPYEDESGRRLDLTANHYLYTGGGPAMAERQQHQTGASRTLTDQ